MKKLFGSWPSILRVEAIILIVLVVPITIVLFICGSQATGLCTFEVTPKNGEGRLLLDIETRKSKCKYHEKEGMIFKKKTFQEYQGHTK